MWKKKEYFNWNQIQRGSLAGEQAADAGRCWSDHLTALAKTWLSSSLCPAGPAQGWVPRRDGAEVASAIQARLP